MSDDDLELVHPEKPEVKERDPFLYQLMMKQLETDGYTDLAAQLGEQTNTEANAEIKNGNKLKRLVQTDSVARKRARAAGMDGGLVDMPIAAQETDLLADMPLSKPFPNYQLRFMTHHQHTSTCAKFSQDGQYVATGSVDCSIKLLDVKKMHYVGMVKGEKSEDYSRETSKPVIRNFYDHLSAINDIDFHPVEPFLVSGSKDCTIKFFDHSKTNKNKKHAYRNIIDTHSVRSVNFHPSGDFLLVGTEHPMIRLYDVNTFQAYVSPEMKYHHLAPINNVRYAPQGNVYASASRDGSIKFWDGVTNKCVNTIKNAHSGEPVWTVQFSPSGKYLLSCGQDSTSRLWELSTGKEVVSYVGAIHEDHRTRAVFSHSGDFVLCSSEEDNSICAWDTRTGELVKTLPGHNQPVRWLEASPTEEGLISCGEDFKVRFWSEVDK